MNITHKIPPITAAANTLSTRSPTSLTCLSLTLGLGVGGTLAFCLVTVAISSLLRGLFLFFFFLLLLDLLITELILLLLLLLVR
jgi:hypothetical protein